MPSNLPKPKLFYCIQCQEFFVTQSKKVKPCHSKCHGKTTVKVGTYREVHSKTEQAFIDGINDKGIDG